VIWRTSAMFMFRRSATAVPHTPVPTPMNT
jgi:hypothetical protein